MSERKSVYLLAGGRGSANKVIFEEIFKELARPKPVIAYIGAASDDDRDFFRFMSDQIGKAGDCEVRHVLTVRPKADLDEARNILRGVDAVFVSGGDVEAGVNVLKARNMLGLLQELFHRGTLFFGASAGSIMLGSRWVRWDDPDDDSSAELFDCLGIAPLICDTHAEADDWIELKTALALEKAGTAGYGIPSGGCLKVFPDGRMAALGRAVERYIRKGQEVRKLEKLELAQK